MSWYVVQTQPRREEVAEVWLSPFCARVFCPRHRASVNVHGYRREVARPLFPGYLFASFDVSTALRAVHYGRGTRGVVRFGGEPAEVPPEIIGAIEARMRGGYVVLEPPRFEPGQRIEVIEGPLRGYTGIFQREMSGAKRVAILLEGLRLFARAVVSRDAVRPL